MLRHNAIYATFPNAHDAEKSAGALMDHGVRTASVSFIVTTAQMELPVSAGTSYVTETVPYDPIPINTPLRSAPDIVSSDNFAMAADAPIDIVEADHVHILDTHRSAPHAATGITTTTGRDAAKGAFEGAGVGIGLGALLGIAAVMIPGVGWVAGAGALVAGLAAATGAAGAVAGGAYGFLADLGLPPHQTQQLQSHLQMGGSLLSISLVDGVPETEIIQILEKYGATSAQAF